MMFSGANLPGITCVDKVGLLLHIMIPITDYIHKLKQYVSIGYYIYWYYSISYQVMIEPLILQRLNVQEHK